MNSADQEMLDLFVQESSEHIQTLERELISLEANPAESSLLHSIFRAVHSIKGAAGFFGFEHIVRLAHVMESVMALVRDGKRVVDQSLVSLLISTSDKLNLMLADPFQASEIPCASETASLQAILDGNSKPSSNPLAPATAKPDDVPSAPVAPIQTGMPHELEIFQFTPESLIDPLKHGKNFFVLTFELKADLEAQGQQLPVFFNEVESLGTIIDTCVSVPESCKLATAWEVDPLCTFFYATPLEPFILSGALGLEQNKIQEIPSSILREWVKANSPAEPIQGEIKPAPTPSATPEPAQQKQPQPVAVVKSAPAVKAEISSPATPVAEPINPKPIPANRRKPDETIRINVSLLDSLMNLAGEMVLGRNRLLRLATNSSNDNNHEGLQSIVQEISSVTTKLQDTIMRARLQPVGGLFGKFNRIVRDLSHKLEKEIQLEIFGDDVELDRTLLEGLSDPLTHLVRNSVDHGIEKPDQRLASGKHSCGLIRLSAAHLAGRVQIEVLDDGGGMDPERLKQKAVEKGLITTEQAARMSDPEALQLIFAAGFSTASALSDISGRGVGMDVVKTNIEKLGGYVELDSRKGEGTRIIIRLPLTLAIVPALIVGCREMRYAIPQINVEEIVHPGEEYPLKHYGGAWVLQLRGQLVPVVDLATILGYESEKSPSQSTFVIVLQLDHMTYGLIVNEIISNEEIVVKPLGKHLRIVSCYSGATLLGQGEIALILDPAALAQGRISPTQQALSSSKSHTLETHQTQLDRVLIFQDGDAESFAIHLSNVLRVERIKLSDIERLGAIDYLRKNHESTIRLIRLANFLPIRLAPVLENEVFVIVPRPPFDHIGVIATRIVDSVDLSLTQVDSSTFPAPGVFGSAHLLDRLTLIIDFPALAQLMEENSSPTSVLAEAHLLLTTNQNIKKESPFR